MSGIVFFKTCAMEEIKEFYISKIGMKIWLEREDCIILKHDNLLLGFCSHDEIDNAGIITFVYKNTDQVYEMYKKLKLFALDDPQVNEKYKIYHFFVKDPEDRLVEFQTFLHSTKPIS